jgi:1-acyl-sn-glycerol-3-phosphate acyltransferase
MGVHPILNRTLGAFFRLFVRKTHGLKNVPVDSPFIVAANHDSYFDPLIIYALLLPKVNQKIHWLAMMGRFWKFFGDKIAHDWIGCVPLDQGKKRALKELESFLKKGENVGIFPGGPRSLDGSLTKGRTGAARLVLGARVPIIPAGLIGTYEIAPRDKIIPRLKRAEVRFGKPMYFDKYYGKKVTKKLLVKITDDVMVQIAKLAKKRYSR